MCPKDNKLPLPLVRLIPYHSWGVVEGNIYSAFGLRDVAVGACTTSIEGASRQLDGMGPGELVADAEKTSKR